MNQCVPSWGFDENPNNQSNPKLPYHTHSNSISSAPNVPTLDYEVAELTWENGQLSMHGLGQPRVPNKLQSTASTAKYTWEKPRAGETLEAIVNQATFLPPYKIDDFGSCGGGDELVPWFDNNNHPQHHRSDATTVPISVSASANMTMDALVPCRNARDEDVIVSGKGTGAGGGGGVCSTRVGSCAGNNNNSSSKFERQRVGRVEAGGAAEWSSRDSGSATFGRELSVRGLTSTSIGSPGNTSSGKNGGKSTTGDEHDSVYSHSKPQREADKEEENKKKGKGKSSISTKRSRAAAIHNQSERKRRDKINQRMKTLQKMVPNSSKTDKASMLDEVIEYLKQLQAQVHVMSRVSPPAMMMPLAMQQQLQMSMMNPMAAMGMAGMGMGMGMNVMDFNSLAGRTNIHGMPSVLHPTAFMPLGSWDGGNGVVGDRIPPQTSLMQDPMSAFLACQSQPMTMDAYSRMAAMFQQMHQQSQGHCSNKNQ